jgi:UPF0755 protein
MLKKILGTICVLWILIFGTYFLGANYYKGVIDHPFSLNSDQEEFKINKGDTLYSIIASLDKDGKLKNSLILKYYIKKNNINVSLKPGVSIISNNMTLNDFINSLEDVKAEVDPNIFKITIPEGYDINQIAKLFEDKGIVSKDDFLKNCKEYTIPSYVTKDPKRKYQLEGYLFPDTYEFKKGINSKQIIDSMLKRFETVLGEAQKNTGKNINSEVIDKIVIMASIVEREVAKEDERKLAASVFFNRLDKGMKLESCATVIYALGQHKDVLTNNDLKVDSPFNTYIVKALPQGPICSPGKASIEAALNPANTNYLYFVSKNDGTHEFNETFDNHLVAQRKYQNVK